MASPKGNAMIRWNLRRMVLVLVIPQAGQMIAAADDENWGLPADWKKSVVDEISTLNKALRLDPKNAELYGKRAAAYTLEGDPERTVELGDACRSLRRGRRFHPGHPVAKEGALQDRSSGPGWQGSPRTTEALRGWQAVPSGSVSPAPDNRWG
jgi:hypothetical protein